MLSQPYANALPRHELYPFQFELYLLLHSMSSLSFSAVLTTLFDMHANRYAMFYLHRYVFLSLKEHYVTAVHAGKVLYFV